MKVLILGSGGREHALTFKVSQSPQVEKVYAIPGNGGMADIAECVALSLNDFEALAQFVTDNQIDLTVVGPEAPLCEGVVDFFESKGLAIFGPRQNAAMMEASKAFTKGLCSRHNIPTAAYETFSDLHLAQNYIKQNNSFPIVIKADGLAAGKGVLICESAEDALAALDDIMAQNKFGEAGAQVVIEEFMQGEEASFMVATDGRDFVYLESSQDHKRIFDGDKGLNTGGMGAYSPAPVLDENVRQKVEEQIIKPTLKGLMDEDRPYKGILYAGLMIQEGNPRLVEYNCRFGDPEAQAILFRLESDIIDMMQACIEDRVKDYQLQFSDQTAVCVVMSSQGYPGSYEKGKEIEGLDKLKNQDDVFVFHAGTQKQDDKIVTSGGRVLGVTAKAGDLQQAIDKAYQAVEKIDWEGAYWREDIGQKGLKRLSLS